MIRNLFSTLVIGVGAFLIVSGIEEIFAWYRKTTKRGKRWQLSILEAAQRSRNSEPSLKHWERCARIILFPISLVIALLAMNSVTVQNWLIRDGEKSQREFEALKAELAKENNE